MRLPAIDSAMEECREHLSTSGAFGTAIEAFLTQYMLTLMCAHFEIHIEGLLRKRAAASQDAALESLVVSSVSAIFRSCKTSEIAGLLNRFGSDYKDQFQRLMEESPQAVTRFNNIITNRHKTAHDSGSNITFDELIRSYDEGHIVLDAVEKVMFQL